MNDPHEETNELLIWASDVANKAKCNSTTVVVAFSEIKKRDNVTIEQAKIITENTLINGGNTNEG